MNPAGGAGAAPSRAESRCSPGAEIVRHRINIAGALGDGQLRAEQPALRLRDGPVAAADAAAGRAVRLHGDVAGAGPAAGHPAAGAAAAGLPHLRPHDQRPLLQRPRLRAAAARLHNQQSQVGQLTSGHVRSGQVR